MADAWQDFVKRAIAEEAAEILDGALKSVLAERLHLEDKVASWLADPRRR